MSNPLEGEAEFKRTVDAQEEDLRKSKRQARLRSLLMVIVTMLAVLFGLLCAWLAWENERLADANAAYGQEQAQEKQTIAKEAQKALCGTKDREIYDQSLCEKWAEVAQEPAPAAPAPADGPSQAELVAAFREYCADGNCRGRDGASPTPDDIAAAFVKFCADGRCTGPAGKDAPPAKDGKDGAPGVAGEQGADGQSLGPTQEMVLAAVTTYCASNSGCRGPAGADGAAGPPPADDAILAAVQRVCTSSDVCRGPAGPVGATGEKGDPGERGPAPESFTFTWANTTYTCTPNPPGSTTYACDPTGPPPPVIGVGP